MKKIRKLQDGLCKFEEWICIVLLIAMVIVVVLQVFFRYCLNNPLTWTEELSRFIFIWLIGMGCGYCITKDDHVKVEMLVDMMPTKVQKIIGIIMDVLPLIAFAYLIPFAWKFTVAQHKIRSTALHLKYSFVYGACFVCAILIVIHLILKLVLMLDKGTEEKK